MKSVKHVCRLGHHRRADLLEVPAADMVGVADAGDGVGVAVFIE